MKLYRFVIPALFMFFTFARTQTIEDLNKLEKFRKQLEETATLTNPAHPDRAAESLVVFQDQLSTVPDSFATISPLITAKADSQSGEKEPFRSLTRFGMDIFEKARIDYKPEIFGPVDEEYPLGPGDELVVSVWGEVELRHTLVIDRQGQIFIPEIGLVNANGVTLGEFKQRLRGIMGKSYSSIVKNKAFLDVALGKLRSIRIYVVGDVQSPGVFTVPALTSPFQMLFYAGGISETGSLRDISLMRNDKVIQPLDMYEFLIRGLKLSGIRLQTNDVIHVSSAGRLVYLDGAVNKPAVYELLAREGLEDLIRFSGGLKPDAIRDHIQIERIIDNRERRIIDVSLADEPGTAPVIPLLHGDRVFVERLDRELENYVTVTGPIYGPARFEYESGLTIRQLFARIDSIRGDAYLDRIQITREMPNRRLQIFSINLNAILEGKQADFKLAPRDQVKIESITTLFPEEYVRIFGAVNRPGQYTLKKNMTLKDLIFEAEGFREDAVIGEAEISRINPKNGTHESMAAILYVTIDTDYVKLDTHADEAFFLKPYDNVFIRENSEWELQRNVVLLGEVLFPGVYTLRHKRERITDIIARAGGLKPTAYLEGATLVRELNSVGQIGLNFERLMKDADCDENIFLRNGDRIEIPEKSHTVKVVGGVNFPSSVLFNKGKGLNYYIGSAGGYRELADKKNVTIQLADGRVIQQKRFIFWKYLPNEITAGSTIHIPVLTEKDGIDWSGTIRDTAAILSSVATTILIIDRVK